MSHPIFTRNQLALLGAIRASSAEKVIPTTATPVEEPPMEEILTPAEPQPVNYWAEAVEEPPIEEILIPAEPQPVDYWAEAVEECLEAGKAPASEQSPEPSISPPVPVATVTLWGRLVWLNANEAPQKALHRPEQLIHHNQFLKIGIRGKKIHQITYAPIKQVGIQGKLLKKLLATAKVNSELEKESEPPKLDELEKTMPNTITPSPEQNVATIINKLQSYLKNNIWVFVLVMFVWIFSQTF